MLEGLMTTFRSHQTLKRDCDFQQPQQLFQLLELREPERPEGSV